MIPLADLVVVVAIAAACSLAVAGIGVLVLRRVYARSLLASLSVVVCISVGAVAAGAIGTARAMFITTHDLAVLVIVIGVAGSISLATAFLLGRAVLKGSRALGVAARDLSDAPYQGAQGPLTAELSALDRQLALTSARLRESRERERALESGRRELVAWVSHDLRTPLAGIRAMAEALEDGVVADSDGVQQYHSGIRQEADRMAGMVDDLFELSRINASALNLVLQEVSLEDIVSDAVASATPLAEAKGVRLVGTSAERLPPIQGSVPELGRVLRNVLSNAIRHTPADGVVTVRAGAGENFGVVEIADACGGIPPADLPRLFEVAFRGTPARTPNDDGGNGGLGLAIAQGLVHAHCGDISIRNSGPGCVVRIRLPAASLESSLVEHRSAQTPASEPLLSGSPSSPESEEPR